MNDKRTKVIEVATQLFAKNGFENTSMATICHEANVSKGLIYHHFTSKDAILIEIFKSVTRQMTEMTKHSKSELRPLDQLIELIDDIFYQLENNKLLFQFNVSLMFNPKTRSILKEELDKRAGLLFTSIKEIFNQISKKKSEVMSYMFIAEIDGIALSYLSVYENYPIDLMKKELINKYKILL